MTILHGADGYHNDENETSCSGILQQLHVVDIIRVDTLCDTMLLALMASIASHDAVKTDSSFHQSATLRKALDRALFVVIECAGPLDHLEISAWSDHTSQVFGFTKAEAIGQGLANILLTPNGGLSWQDVALAEGGGPIVCKHARKDGTWVICEWLTEPMLDENGKRIGFLFLGRDITEQTRAQQEAEQHKLILRTILDTLGIVVCQYDAAGVFTFQDGKGLAAAGMKPGQLVGMSAPELYAANADALAGLRRGLAGERIHSRTEAHDNAWETWFIPPLDNQNHPAGMTSITLDASESMKRELELRAKIELVEKQQQVIRELSTPILEIWDRVLTLPMVGVVDSARTSQVMENLLSAIVSKGAQFAILDLTGVETIDTSTAGHLINLIRAIELLGAEGIITGILPSVAQTLVSLDIDLGSVVTRSNLRAGLKVCMDRMSPRAGKSTATKQR